MEKATVIFEWEQAFFKGMVEKEYENSFLINVSEPSCSEIKEKFANRMIISKKNCEIVNNISQN